MIEIMPKCWNKATKPDLFCPGCGHGIVLKHLGYAIDTMEIRDKVTLGIDIGCSLLAWNFFNFDTVQTHHGRTAPTMLGYKRAQPERIALAYMGDGGAYAIGLQSILHAAMRNEPITIIVVNNENYAMTGGQASPTTETGTITITTPLGKAKDSVGGLKGPELVRMMADKNAYVARTTMANPIVMQNMIKKAIKTQAETNNFAFLEILSICPTNWRTNAKESLHRVVEMEKHYPLGEFLKEDK